VKSSFYYLSKMSRREIKSHWSQFLAVILIGGVAVTLFVGLLANAESIENRVDKAYDEGNMADLWLTTSAYDSKDIESISSIIGDDGSVEGRFEAPGRISRNTVYSAISPTMPSISKPYELEEGSIESDTTFVYVDTALAHGTGESSEAFEIGKSLDVDYDLSSYISSDIANMLSLFVKSGGHNIFKDSSIKLTYTITGIMYYPENVTKAAYNSSTILVDDATFKNQIKSILEENFTSPAVDMIFQYFSTSSLNWGDGTTSMEGTFAKPNQYLVSLKDHSKSDYYKDKIEEYFSEKDSNNLANSADRSTMAFVTTMHNDVVQARQFTFLFPFVFFFVAVLVILTTISQVILKERTQIGTMKALGISNGAIMAHYMSLTGTIVGIGIVLGEIIGPLLIPYILGQKYDILYTLPARTYVFPVLYGILTAVGFLLVSCLVTYLVCRKEIKLNPAESMRPAAPKIKAHESLLNKKNNSVRFLSLKMAFRNIRMNLVKSFMVIAGVGGCTALLVCGFGIEDTINYDIDHDMDLGNNANISLTFSSPQTRSKLKNDLDIDGITSYEPLTRSMSVISPSSSNDAATCSSYIYILGNDEDSHMKVDFSMDKVAISSKVANALSLGVGDSVTFSYGSSYFTGIVDTVYEAFIFNGVMVHASSPILSSFGEVTFQGVYIDCQDESKIPDVKEKCKSLSYVIEADTQSDWRGQINDVMSGVLIMTNAVKVFAIILAVVVLYNLALLNFRERTRDIATLKVLGFSKKEIASSLLWETMTLTFLGVLVGMLLGYPFMLGVLKLNIVDLVEYIFHISPLSYVYSFLLTFVVAFVVNSFLSYRSGQVKMVESLKSVE
jgi:ABC-type antimicrobial peptide transport system permease subunit